MTPEQREPLKVSEPRTDKMRFAYCIGQLRRLRYPADSDGGSRDRKLNRALVRQMAVVEREALER